MKRKPLLLALAMAFGLAAPAGAAEAADAQIVILHTNDVHCQIDPVTDPEIGSVTSLGYAGVAAYKAEMEAQYGAENVILVDAGDAIQGGPVGTLSQGSYIVDIMNQVGYDLAVPGNHEFDYGMDNFLDLARNRAQYPYLCANFTDLEGNPILDAYTLVEAGGVTVGFVGIDTPESFTKSTPTYFQDGNGNYIYSFCQGNDGQDLYDAVQAAVDAATAAGADYVVAVGHLGNEGSTDVWTSTAVIANTTGIDLFIDGHSHETYDQVVQNAGGEDVILAQTGTKLASLGKVTIDTATGDITAGLVSGYAQQDPGAAAFVAQINEAFAGVLQEVVARTDVALTTLDPDTGERAVRSAETNLGDLCADAYRTLLGADVAFVNGGGIRADIAAGDITYEDIINVHPFGNEACLVETSGQDLLDALELGARLYPEENGGFLQVSGLTYTIDASVPSSVVLSDEGAFVEVAGAYRVKDVAVNGAPLDLTATYTLASHNYMIKSGGDGFVMFMDDNLLQDSVLIDNQVLINYIVDELGGVVGEEYADPRGQGRITVVNAAETPEETPEEAPQEAPETPRGRAAGDQGARDAPAVNYVIANGIMGSTSAGANVFSPNGAVTRATVFQTFYNMAGQPAVAEAASFPDAAGAWYAASAAWAEDVGLTTGDGSGAYAGDRAVTRAELATIVVRFAQYQNRTLTAGDLSAFADAGQVAAWAGEGLSLAVGSGLLSGKSSGLLDPNGTAVRAELATILMNYAGSAAPEESPVEEAQGVLSGTVTAVSRYGNITTDLSLDAVAAAGFEAGDLLTVTVGETTLEAPFGAAYSDVDTGSVVVLPDSDANTLAAAINMGNFSETYGAVEGTVLTFAMAEKAGYLEEYQIRNIDALRTNDRADYASDEVFANFRPIVMGDIAQGVLYRSSSPVNPELGRNTYADALAQAAGIRTVLNLADSQEVMEAYEGYAESNYATLNVIPLEMGVDFAAGDFAAKLKTGLEFLLANEGPYLIHCNEGKDRAGFVSAVLEALMGASLDEIVADYMTSYVNYYHVEAGSERYNRIAESNILSTLRTLAGLEEGADLASADLQAAAAAYLTDTVGLSAQQVEDLQALLSGAAGAEAAA